MNKPEELERLPVMVVKIAARYVRKNRLRPTDVPLVLQTISDALRSVHEAGPIGEAPQPAPKLVPAVPIKKSLTDDVIICLEDGKKFKSLRRHLRVAYGMTPEEYRAKWGLPPDYPMVAPNYAAARSRLAREMGLGRKQAEDPAPVAAPKKPRKKAAA